ncbi:hypothetical protein BC567DRAFT_218057 [Phyllosticta citribraziliensis]
MQNAYTNHLESWNEQAQGVAGTEWKVTISGCSFDPSISSACHFSLFWVVPSDYFREKQRENAKTRKGVIQVRKQKQLRRPFNAPRFWPSGGWMKAQCAFAILALARGRSMSLVVVQDARCAFLSTSRCLAEPHRLRSVCSRRAAPQRLPIRYPLTQSSKRMPLKALVSIWPPR